MYIVHTSSRDAMEAVALARARGQVAFSEVLSQHLVIDDSVYNNPNWRDAQPLPLTSSSRLVLRATLLPFRPSSPPGSLSAAAPSLHSAVAPSLPGATPRTT